MCNSGAAIISLTSSGPLQLMGFVFIHAGQQRVLVSHKPKKHTHKMGREFTLKNHILKMCGGKSKRTYISNRHALYTDTGKIPLSIIFQSMRSQFC